MSVGVHVALIAAVASMLLAGGAILRARSDHMRQPEKLTTALTILAVYAAAVVAYDLWLALDENDSSPRYVHDYSAGRWILHGLVLAVGVAALVGARWPLACSWVLVGAAVAAPISWIVFISAYAEVTGEDVGDAGLLVVILVPAVSGPFVAAAMSMRQAVRERRVTVERPPPDGDRSPSWQPDPTGRHELRWWNGTHWTVNVANGGKTSHDSTWPV